MNNHELSILFFLQLAVILMASPIFELVYRRLEYAQGAATAVHLAPAMLPLSEPAEEGLS